MKYTIEQINEAWEEYQRPLYLVNKTIANVNPGEMIPWDDMHPIQTVEKVDFVRFIIQYFNPNKKKDHKHTFIKDVTCNNPKQRVCKTCGKHKL